ncbi:hypothetical protein N7519_006623 [Penicillium mononematosum]|uniref:uncharacterized protein n=1 Tax=Penicillium mononematosum TaxID=268346 RepID=UPI002549AA50|nr:uncharacterized protein N7519_006623 [Penicillium mononematosum]KAJ6185322.1 hypothetical protein N7519_006623 [Penicillium mononematosum]
MSSSVDPTSLLVSAAVPAFKCPAGTKMHILNLGTLQEDESWILRGCNASSLNNLNPVNRRRDLVVLSALIEYPGVGLILYETGCAENVDSSLAICTLTMRGGLEHFVNTDVPIYVHEEELKHACWAVATGADFGVYLGQYMLLEELKWNTFTGSQLDLFQGITFHHSPGHTPGLCIMQINLSNDGPFIWTSDQFHVAENYELGHPHGGLARDHSAWYRSLNMIRRLQRLYNATLIFGHDTEVAYKLINAKPFYD